MRKALGFTIDDNVDEVLNTYATLAKLFSKGDKITLKQNKEEKSSRYFFVKFLLKIRGLYGFPPL